MPKILLSTTSPFHQCFLPLFFFLRSIFPRFCILRTTEIETEKNVSKFNLYNHLRNSNHVFTCCFINLIALNICNKNFSSFSPIDHMKQVVQYGNNSRSNLQPLSIVLLTKDFRDWMAQYKILNILFCPKEAMFAHL